MMITTTIYDLLPVRECSDSGVIWTKQFAEKAEFFYTSQEKKIVSENVSSGMLTPTQYKLEKLYYTQLIIGLLLEPCQMYMSYC